MSNFVKEFRKKIIASRLRKACLRVADETDSEDERKELLEIAGHVEEFARTKLTGRSIRQLEPYVIRAEQLQEEYAERHNAKAREIRKAT